MKTTPIIVAHALWGLAGPAQAQTIKVDIEDASIFDVDPDATVADLPGPDGHISFGEAMVASNNTPGRQTVAFAIPVEEWTHHPEWYPGRAVIFGWVPNMSASDEVTIDGTTQTDFTGDTNPDGWEVQFLTEFFVVADHCTVTGLHAAALWIEGSNCVVENNSSMGIHLYGGYGSSGDGSGTLVKGNTGGGFLRIDQSSGNVVVGNTFDQVRIYGYVAGGFPAVNNRIGGPAPAERNSIIGTGTWSEHGVPGGFALQILDAIGTVVENNWIGTTPDGLQQGHPASIMGIYFDGENHDTLIRNNRIAGILAWVYPPHGDAYQIGAAIQLYGSGSGVSIVGNKIGLNADDEPVLGSITGITTVHFFYPHGIQNVVIGGAGEGEGNEIAGHLGSGVSVTNTFSGVRIYGNSIHDNADIGIDLVTALFEYGVTLNDSGDADSGGNNLQNFPVLASATVNGQSTTIVGDLDSAPSRAYTVEFFSSPTCDPSGYGEGESYLGSAIVTTNGNGHAELNAQVSAAASGSAITATATDQSTGDTSEFSACITAEGGNACYPDFTGDGALDLFDFLAYVNAFNAADPTADCTGDGALDLFDFLCFVNQFNLGC